MERRLTAFVLPVLLVAFALVLFFREDPRENNRPEDEAPTRTPAAAPLMAEEPAPQPPGAAPAQNGQEPLVEKIFGFPGETGSFHIVFDRHGASVRSIRLLDEPASSTERKQGDWAIEDSYELVRPFPVRVRGTGRIGEVPSLELGQGPPQEGDPRLRVSLGNPWTVKDLSDGIEFTLRDEETKLVLRRTYRHEPGSRELVLEISIEGDAQRDDAAEELLASGRNLSLWLYGLSLVNPGTDHVLGNPAVAICRMMDEDTLESQVIAEAADGKPDDPAKQRIGYGRNSEFVDFAGTTNRFFGGFLRPSNEAAQYALTRVNMEKRPRGDLLAGYAPYSVPVANYRLSLAVPKAGERTNLEFRLYLGPKSSGVFDERPEYDRYQVVMDRDLQPMCPCSIPGAVFMAKSLLWGLRQLHSLVGSWGVAIMLLTFIVRGSLVPLNFRMQRSMRAFGARAARLQPKLDEIKKRNANDPKKMQQEMMAFQREHKLFPPLGGCLPLLVTIPVFLGLFTALRVAYELRCQPFIGWIDDLSLPDRLFEVGLPFMPYFNLLPILMVVLWLVLQSGTPLPKDPQQRQVMKIMRFMPLMFGVMLYNYAAGLMVYMVTSSLFGIIEQRVTRKILGPPPEAGAGVAAMPTF